VRGRRGDPDSSPRTVRTFRPVRSASCSWVGSARCRHSRSRVPSLGSSRARPSPAAPHEPMANDIPIVSGKCRAKDRLMPGCLPDIHTTSPVRAHGRHRSGCRQHRQMSGRCPVGCLDPAPPVENMNCHAELPRKTTGKGGDDANDCCSGTGRGRTGRNAAAGGDDRFPGGARVGARICRAARLASPAPTHPDELAVFGDSARIQARNIARFQLGVAMLAAHEGEPGRSPRNHPDIWDGCC